MASLAVVLMLFTLVMRYDHDDMIPYAQHIQMIPSMCLFALINVGGAYVRSSEVRSKGKSSRTPKDRSDGTSDGRSRGEAPTLAHRAGYQSLNWSPIIR